MSVVILNGFQNHYEWDFLHEKLEPLLLEKNENCYTHELEALNIKPCRSCDSCGHRTPGECTLDDDMHDVLRDIAKSKAVILLTPITFGGYSSQLKKAWDRTMLLGLPLYIVKEGHLLHPMRYGDKALIAIGVIEDDVPGQEENFKLTLERNALNMQSSYHKALIYKANSSKEEIAEQVISVVKEVLQK